MFNKIKGLFKKSSDNKSNFSETIYYGQDTDAKLEKQNLLFQKVDDIISVDSAIKLYKPNFIPKEKIMSDGELLKHVLYAVAIGDITGSRYEGCPYPGLSTSEIIEMTKTRDSNGAHPIYTGYETIDLLTDEHRFTDDTVLTIAVYKATQEIIKCGATTEDEIVGIYTKYLRDYARRYPDAGYASGFERWAQSDTTERNYSYGNGSCMRVSGIALLFENIEDVIRHAYYSALPSHGHSEGIKGAICTAVIYWMLIHDASKNDIIRYLEKHYPNNGEQKIHAHTQLADLVKMNTINPWSTLTVICQTSLVEAVINFMESTSLEGCLRNNYKYLTDRDTIAAISAPMAALFYKDMTVQGIDGNEIVKKYLDEQLLDDINCD